MKVNVIGGGPGGLYASVLLAKNYPDWDIDVYERDPADNTYGWGIVFSDSTLSRLREADYKTHEQITDSFAKWNPIDIHYGGEYIRCGGHAFAGLMRAKLKDILRRRCAELGVEMHWEHNVEDPTSYAEDADLLIGAGGLNSVTRETYEEAFKPRVRMGEAKFAWFGTEKPFDVFTFIFRENDDGLWRVHAYPGEKSTFIVECTEETYENAGLDGMDEQEGLAYFEDLFADHLGDYELESKLYQWRNFPVVNCRTWSHENVVLLGDAAHTAHFSVGSGTKMAMEDAIALQEAFVEKGSDDIEGALNWYEKERRDPVNRIQDAARTSRRYFENTERFTDLEPERFAFNLLTRSGRITYDELKIRDAEYTDNFDRWFAGYATDDDMRAIARPPMFQPLSLRDVTFENRAALTPGPSSEGETGHPVAKQRQRLVDLTEEAAGLVLTEPLAVTENGRLHRGTPGIYTDEHAEYWDQSVAEARDGPVLGAELFHAGRRGATKPRERGLDRPLDDGWELLAPSPISYIGESQTPTEMDEDDMARVREAFVDAAERADEAGFDLLQLNMAHGYLLGSFLSPLTNERGDEYGGSRDARLAYPLEVFDAVREVWPDGKPVTVKLNATDWRPDGFTLGDAFATGNRLAEHGCDLLTIVAGQTTPNDRAKFDADVLERYSEGVRNEINVPTMSTNYVTTTDDVNTQVGRASADLCAWYPPDADVNSL
ncbi:bifunctional salicylyl-CoA 5-hydroxylase/oxidoreductase [Halobacteriales archaeon QH_2_65_14]|nr:MAG: bifunctional salicylyl-CoA 5-hydroxylase/oxidoreductase [Halobacteriales archaeon QH_2_65_14]